MLERLAQNDFSAGMFRGVDAAMIPRNGARDIVGLLQPDSSVMQRGGTYLVSTAGVDDVSGMWTGELTNGKRTVIFSRTAGVLRLNADGTTTVLTATPAATVARPAVYQGKLYWDNGSYDGTVVAAAFGVGHYATVAGRLFRGWLNGGKLQIAFTGVGTVVFGGTDFHELPGGLNLLGLYALRDSLVVFTDGGIYLISGLGMNLTDAAGNIQHRVDLYSDDVLLAGGSWAVEGYEGGLIVPARDGVWTVSLGITSEAPLPLQKISTPIDGLWQGQLLSPAGACVVFDSHYLVPVLVTGEGVDPLDGQVLCCRLDATSARGNRIFPWSRLKGYGANLQALHVRVGPLGEHQLLGASWPTGRRVKGCETWFTRTVATDVDGSSPTLEIVTRDQATGAGNENVVSLVRVGFELAGVSAGLAVQASVLPGADTGNPVGQPWTSLGAAPVAGLSVQSWRARDGTGRALKGRFVRARVLVTDASSAVVRSVEFLTRGSGRQ